MNNPSYRVQDGKAEMLINGEWVRVDQLAPTPEFSFRKHLTQDEIVETFIKEMKRQAQSKAQSTCYALGMELANGGRYLYLSGYVDLFHLAKALIVASEIPHG